MFKKSLFIAFFACFIAFSSNSQVTEQKTYKYLEVFTTSYPDYKPFSYINEDDDLYTIFSKALNEALLFNNIHTKYETTDTFDQNLEILRKGLFSILVGMYNETHTDLKKMDHIEYLYPAVLQNPVSLITINNKSKITNINDLKKLKGVYVSEEYFSDYVLKKFKFYNVQPVENSLEAYKKLFLGQVDYIIGSYYYHYIYSIQNGIKNYISFSKKPLWHMPMFIGISKKAKDYNRLKSLLSKKITDPLFSQKIKEELKERVKIFEQNNIGVVPPSFILEQNENVLTPADEVLIKDN